MAKIQGRGPKARPRPPLAAKVGLGKSGQKILKTKKLARVPAPISGQRKGAQPLKPASGSPVVLWDEMGAYRALGFARR